VSNFGVFKHKHSPSYSLAEWIKTVSEKYS